MKTLPGLPTMAALMLSALIAVWLGLWGPIDIQKLKDWQPLMASIIALAAATLAYRGAMAKVNHDREEAERRRNGERLGLFLRLSASLSRVMIEIRKCILFVDSTLPPPPDGSGKSSVTIKAELMEVYNPPEIAEAWSKIDLFPAPLVAEIDLLRSVLPTLETEINQSRGTDWTIEFQHGERPADREEKLAALEAAGPWERPGALAALAGISRRPDSSLELHLARCRFIEPSCRRVIRGLDDAIPRLRRLD